MLLAAVAVELIPWVEEVLIKDMVELVQELPRVDLLVLEMQVKMLQDLTQIKVVDLEEVALVVIVQDTLEMVVLVSS
jgi:uncharacterized protein with ACT and thioredoxin-like domain